jgi:hypothetical protein
MSLRVVAKVGWSAVAVCAGGLMLSQQQQQYPPGYSGSQTVYGGPGHPQQNIIPLNQPQQQQRIPGQAYTVRVVPCGEFGKPPCGTVVTIPAGATGASLMTMAKSSDASGRGWEAIIYVDEAAMMGFGPAEAALGEDFLEGKGAPQNLVKARYWLGLAADQGDRGSQAIAGEMYERAQGGAPDPAKAVRYYELAAAQHSSRAERALGFDYELGYGVAHDRAEAIAMFRRAGADGWVDATQFANALSRTKVAQFRSEGELDALVYPPPPPAQRGNVPPGCPELLNFPPATLGFMRKAQFCMYHPGCPVQVGGLDQMCPRPLGPTLDQIMHDN